MKSQGENAVLLVFTTQWPKGYQSTGADRSISLFCGHLNGDLFKSPCHTTLLNRSRQKWRLFHTGELFDLMSVIHNWRNVLCGMWITLGSDECLSPVMRDLPLKTTSSICGIMHRLFGRYYVQYLISQGSSYVRVPCHYHHHHHHHHHYHYHHHHHHYDQHLLWLWIIARHNSYAVLIFLQVRVVELVVWENIWTWTGEKQPLSMKWVRRMSRPLWVGSCRCTIS